MKRSIIIILVAVLCLMYLSVAAAQEAKKDTTAQTKITTPKVMASPVKGGESHHMMATDLRSVAEHAKALTELASTGKPIDKAVAQPHADTIGLNLEAAKGRLGKLDSTIADPQKKEMMPDMQAMRDALGKATESYQALKTELAKETPVPEAIKTSATGITENVTKVEMRNKAVMKKLGMPESKSGEHSMGHPIKK